MSFFKILSLFSFSSLILVLSTFYCILTSTFTHAAVFEIQNHCSYTVWAAAVPGGGKELHQGQSWIVDRDADFNSSDRSGRIWGRTNCNFNANRTGKCESGDCDGALNCVSNGAPPATLVEYTLNGFNNWDFFDISLVGGFNIPMEFRGTSSGCTKVIKCTGDINGLCPTELRHPGGCNDPCAVFKNEQFCCRSGNSCGPTAYSRFFKELCPSVYSYPLDDATSMFTCPAGTNYKVVFCP